MPVDDQDKLFFESLSAEDSINEGQCDESELLIVDPPRKGLDKGVIDFLIGKHESKSQSLLKRLIYISCGFDALQRDTKLLLESERWKIKSADVFLLFPGSDHVESVVVFDKLL